MVKAIRVLLLCGLVWNTASQNIDPDVLMKYEISRHIPNLGVEFAEYFQNVSLANLGLSDPGVPSAEDLLCLSDMTQWMNGLASRQYWAMKMIDSWGSFPSGILTGNVFDLGNFDECLAIGKVIGSNRRIKGKYCFLIANKLKIATCLPASCSAANMDLFVEQLLQKIPNFNVSSISMRISDTSCQTSDHEAWDAVTTFTIVILSLTTSMVALSTLYDFFLCNDEDGPPALVKSFSARANCRVLFRIVQSKSNPNVIDCLHGIRCMSLIWVIFSHEFIFTLNSPNLNSFDILSWAIEPFACFVVHGYFAVDSFFVLGGLLVSMIVLRNMEKTEGKLNPLMMYLHRLLRILPVVGMAILIYTKLMTVISGGPMLKSGYHGNEACEKGWFWTMLFVQNYAVLDICLDHTWYLAVDMQLYIISPILLIALYKWGKKAAGGIVLLILMLSGCLFATQMVNNYSMLIKNGQSEDGVANKHLYLATHVHAAPWLIGFLFGYFLHLNRGRKFQLNRLVVWTGWILSLAMLFTSIFALYAAGQWIAPPLSTLKESLYYTLTRLAWPLAICWIIFACMQGYGGLANSFLSTPLWQPISRLSYSMYIWHMFVQEVNSRNVRTNTYFSNYQVMLHFWLDFGFTLLMSLLMYIIFEAPLNGFDILLRPQRYAKEPKLVLKETEEKELKKPEDQIWNESPPTSAAD
ncbi:hypothetical protein KR009_006919 [Drosophila setifemur]|nr:hypothetical protein KR009_006919 [Drosophila setifemur]